MNSEQHAAVAAFLVQLQKISEETGIWLCPMGATAAEIRSTDGSDHVPFQIDTNTNLTEYVTTDGAR